MELNFLFSWTILQSNVENIRLSSQILPNYFPKLKYFPFPLAVYNYLLHVSANTRYYQSLTVAMMYTVTYIGT